MELLMNWLVGFAIWFGVIILFSLITFLIVGVNLNSARGKFPDKIFDYNRKSDILPEKGFFLDTHGHTTASDGWMNPEQFIKWHIANGYNAFVLTDHNTGKNNEPLLALQEKYPEVLIIPGFEWTTWRIHINFLGIMDWDEKVPNNPTDEEIKHAIKKAKDMGAIVQVDHITWTVDRPMLRSGQLTHPTREQLVEWGVDGFEINNEMRWYDPKTVDWLDKMKTAKKLNRPIYIATGTDIHNPLKEWATGWTELLLTEEERKKPSWDIVKNALLDARTKIWVDHDYVQPPESKQMKFKETSLKRKIFPPLFALQYGIEHIPGNLGGILMYVFWVLVSYFPLRLLFEFIAGIGA